MATRVEALARLSNIKQQKQQNIQERYNNIIKKRELYIEQQKQLQEQQRIQEEQKKQQEEQKQLEEQQRKQELQQMKKQASEITALSKQYNTNQGLNKSKINLPQKNNNIKIKPVTPENLSKDLNISKEEAQKKYEKMIQPPTTWQKVTNTVKNAGENTLDKFGIYNLVENSKETAKGLREAMWQSSIMMGVRGGVAGIVDSATTEGASLFEDYEPGILKEYLKGNAIYNTVNTVKNVYETAKDIKENGGNFADITWGAGSKLATEALNNTLNVVGAKNIYDTGKKTTQKVFNATLSKEQRESAQKALLNTTQSYYKDKEKYEKLQQTESKGWQYANDVLEGTGRMVPAITATMITGNPTVGLGTTGLSVKGSSTQEALQKGATLDEAIQTGNLKAVVEMATEKITSGLKIFGKGITDDFVEDLIMKKIKNKALQWGAKTLTDVLGEISEEIISDVAGSVVDKGVYDEKAKLPTFEELKETAKVTAGTTLLLNGLTGGMSSNSTNNTQNTYYDHTTGKKVDSSTQNILNQAEDIIKQNTVSNIEQNPTNNQNNVQNLQQNAVKNQSNVQQQQISQVENKNSLNQNMESAIKLNKIDNNERVNKFNGYTQKEINNISSDKISIANSKSDIVKFAQKAKKVPGNFKIFVGKVANSTANRVKNMLGIDVNNYNISLKNDAIRHSYNHHANKSETLRGQVPITPMDFANIPMIVNEADNIIDAGTNKFGQKAITFEKNIDGNNVVVTYVSNKHKTLELQSFYKFKNNKKSSATASDVLNTSNRTSETDSSTNSFVNNIIPQNTTNMQEQQNIHLSSPKNKTLNPIEIANLKQEDTNTQGQQNISGNIAYKDTTTKVRKHYKSIIDSPYTSDEARAIAKELMGLDTYIPESNVKQLEEADRKISMSGADSELNSLLARATVGGNIKADDIAVGERLIQYYSKIGDKTKLRDAIQATAMAGTTAGQTVQAMSLLNHQTPEGQAVWLQRSVNKMNEDLAKQKNVRILKDENQEIIGIVDSKGRDVSDKIEIFKLSPEMLDKITNSKNKQELNDNLNEVYKELGQQVTKSTIQKIDAWRYFAMLANIRTHNRNVIGNTAMHGIQYGIKNKVAGAIEGVVSKINPNMERTHTIIPASKEVKIFAKADIKNVADRLGLNENKYNPKSRLENNMRTFKSNVMEKTVGKAFEINNKLLEAEDGFGLKAGYTKALAEYMTANKLTPNNITDKQLAKARNYAIQQAQEATFHQNSQLATLINQLSNKNKFAKFMVDAILPFKKTPINIAKTGVQYSPIGLAKNMVYDTVQLRKGNITANQYIDNISKGLTGTGVALVGFALASMGILKASGSEDDDKEKYDQSRGSQTYSVQIGDNTYSLDWLAPTAIPLFVGAECFEIMEESRETKSSISTDDDSSYNQAIQSAVNVLDSFTNAMNPMTEMSMLSGLSSALKSYEQGSSQVLSTFGTNAVKSYVNQFVPTALGQIAKTTDEYERSTTSTKTGVLPKAVDTTKNQIMSKIPGLRQMLPVKTDIWGNELKQSDNMVLRALENSTFPWTRKAVANSKVDIELSKLYEDTGESSVLPDTLDKTFTINKQKYRLTNEEYSEYKDRYGRTSYKLLRELVTTNDYKNMTTDQKQKAVENVYSYAKELNKVDYANNNNIEVEVSSLYKAIDKLKNDGDFSYYFNYLGKLSTIEKVEKTDKIKCVLSLNLTDDEAFNLYKCDIFNSEEREDGTSQVTDAEFAIENNMTSKAEYIKLYNKCQTYHTDMPNTEDLEQLLNQKIKLETYVDYRVNVTKETVNQRRMGKIENNKGIDTNSKIKIVLNSNYTNSEKASIYENYIGTQDELYSTVMKNTDINITEYLNYKTQEFSADKKDDGTVDGKSISGSKKKKVYAYVNNMKITGNQRLLLLGTQYKLTNSERQALAQYVKSLNITNKEKLAIYDKLQGFTVYKDGRVTF